MDPNRVCFYFLYYGICTLLATMTPCAIFLRCVSGCWNWYCRQTALRPAVGTTGLMTAKYIPGATVHRHVIRGLVLPLFFYSCGSPAIPTLTMWLSYLRLGKYPAKNFETVRAVRKEPGKEGIWYLKWGPDRRWRYEHWMCPPVACPSARNFPRQIPCDQSWRFGRPLYSDTALVWYIVKQFHLLLQHHKCVGKAE